jgi:hypothetical protein
MLVFKTCNGQTDGQTDRQTDRQTDKNDLFTVSRPYPFSLGNNQIQFEQKKNEKNQETNAIDGAVKSNLYIS